MPGLGGLSLNRVRAFSDACSTYARKLSLQCPLAIRPPRRIPLSGGDVLSLTRRRRDGNEGVRLEAYGDAMHLPLP